MYNENTCRIFIVPFFLVRGSKIRYLLGRDIWVKTGYKYLEKNLSRDIFKAEVFYCRHNTPCQNTPLFCQFTPWFCQKPLSMPKHPLGFAKNPSPCQYTHWFCQNTPLFCQKPLSLPKHPLVLPKTPLRANIPPEMNWALEVM